MALSLRHQIFAQQYALTGNAAEAARLAGYSPQSAKVSGCRLLTKDNAIQAAIQACRDEFAVEFQVTKERVIGGLLDAIDLARLQGNASAMISAWRELGQICGIYQHTHEARPDLGAVTKRVNEQLETLSDAELLRLLALGDQV